MFSVFRVKIERVYAPNPLDRLIGSVARRFVACRRPRRRADRVKRTATRIRMAGRSLAARGRWCSCGFGASFLVAPFADECEEVVDALGVAL